MSNHSLGLLAFEKDRHNTIFADGYGGSLVSNNGEGFIVAEVWSDVPAGEYPGNAERLRDCWNACNGVEFTDDATGVVKEMVESLRCLSDILQSWEDGDITNGDLPDLIENDWATIRALLSRVKLEATQ